MIIESTTSENDEQTDLMPILVQFLSKEEFESIEGYHYTISKCLGHPVGLCKLIAKRNPDKYHFDSLNDKQNQLLVTNLLEESD